MSAACRILALSATPGSDMKAVQQVVRNLHIACIEARDDADPDIRKYTHDRKVDVVTVPLAKDVARAGHPLAVVQAHDRFFATLAHEDMPVQVAQLILRRSGVPKFTYLSRVTPSSARGCRVRLRRAHRCRCRRQAAPAARCCRQRHAAHRHHTARCRLPRLHSSHRPPRPPTTPPSPTLCRAHVSPRPLRPHRHCLPHSRHLRYPASITISLLTISTMWMHGWVDTRRCNRPKSFATGTLSTTDSTHPLPQTCLAVRLGLFWQEVGERVRRPSALLFQTWSSPSMHESWSVARGAVQHRLDGE